MALEAPSPNPLPWKRSCPAGTTGEGLKFPSASGEGLGEGESYQRMRDPHLTARAQTMRRTMTGPEALLWRELRAGRFRQVKFRRQKVIQDETRKAIADFAANDPKLVIELDGETHAGREAADSARTRFLEGRGYCVIRFTNADVMTNIEGVLWRIGEVIDELRLVSPSPNPLP